MIDFKLSYIFDGWDIRVKTVSAKDLQSAKNKLRKQLKGKATSITIA